MHVKMYLAAHSFCKFACIDTKLYLSQSIYGDDFQFLGLEGDDSEECTVDDVDVLTSLEKPSGPVSLHCQVLVRLELDEPLTIIVGDSDDAAVSVKHLPPLCLHLLLPHGYPSSCLPDVQLTTPWLRVHEQNAVVEQLLELGSGMLGYPVVFEWTQWVKVCAVTTVFHHFAASEPLA